MSDHNTQILIGLLFYGLFGGVGQIVRAVVALGGSKTVASGTANQQSLFNAAYFVVTLIVGFVAGLLAALVAFDTLTDPFSVKIALAAMAAGYAGADFVENTYSALGASDRPKALFFRGSSADATDDRDNLPSACTH